LSDRQVGNLLKRTSIEGDKAIISKKRGRRGNNTKPAEFKSNLLHNLTDLERDKPKAEVNMY
jgi:hypothetical protein